MENNQSFIIRPSTASVLEGRRKRHTVPFKEIGNVGGGWLKLSNETRGWRIGGEDYNYYYDQQQINNGNFDTKQCLLNDNMKLLNNKWEHNLRDKSDMKKEKKLPIDISIESKLLYHTLRQFPDLQTLALSCYHRPNQVQVNTIENSNVKRMQDTNLSMNQNYNQFKSTKSLVSVLHNQIELSKKPTMNKKQNNSFVNKNRNSLQSTSIVGNKLNNAVKIIQNNKKLARNLENSIYSLPNKSSEISSKPNNLLYDNNNNFSYDVIATSGNSNNNNNNNNNNKNDNNNSNIDHLQKAKNIIFNQCNISVDEGTLVFILSGDSNINFLSITDFRQKLYSYLHIILSEEELFALHYFLF